MEKKREIWLDVLRSFACISVLLVHSPIPFDGSMAGKWVLAPTTYVLMASGVAVFFMISGSLLFYKEQEFVPFIKKRLSRIMYPVIIWSIIYIIVDTVRGDTFVLSAFLSRVCLIPFVSQVDVMWFMYVLLGIYLVAPILSSWLSRCCKRDVEVVLGVWMITLCIPYFVTTIPSIEGIVSTTGSCYYFSGFLGYALLGFYLRKYTNRNVKAIIYISLIVSIFVPLFILITGILPKSSLNGLCNLHSMALATSVFLIVKIYCIDLHKLPVVIERISNFSFGIYLTHMLFIEPINLLIKDLHLHYIVQIPLSAVITGVLSLILVALINRLPFARYLIG